MERATAPIGRSRERGSAMVIAVLVTVILTLLGVSFLLMAETENRIAENERLSSQALYFGEAGARQVKRWFDRPNHATNLLNPPVAVVDRTQRLIDHDGDPATAPHPQDGATWPRYKQGVDNNADGVDDLFRKPYRSALVDTLLGTEAGPDMVIDRAAGGATAAFLDNLSGALLANYPSAGNLRARIRRIDVYQPPYVNVGGTWTRYGMGTIKVIAQILDDKSGTERILAERMIKAVLNETPFPGPFGPLHSCVDLELKGNFSVHWGTSTALQSSDLQNNPKKYPASLARMIPPSQRIDLLWGSDDSTGAKFASYLAVLDGQNVDDPWARHLSGGPMLNTGAPSPADPQPWPFPWAVGQPYGDQDYEVTAHSGGTTGALSHLMQNQPVVTCPEFDYETWKSIATSGGSDVHYFVWDSGTSFRENGFGTASTFRDITNNAEGLFFFDTRDGNPPADTDSDGLYDNLTPEIRMSGGTWGMRGFMYLNSETFQTRGIAGYNATFAAPAEPYADLNQDGAWQSGEPYVNLDYPTSLGGTIRISSGATDDDPGGVVTRNTKGPDITHEASLWGILYTNGWYDATGNATYFGSVITKQGVSNDPAAGTPDLYWDESILYNWPPESWDLPRVVITRWETDL